MIFNDLESRFNAAAASIYAQYSNGTSVEIKPNDPSKNSVDSDTRSFPIGSTARDLTRMAAFLKSSKGVQFLVEQQLLQTGNAISETRQINPLFILENVPPFIHAQRSLRTQQDEQLTDSTRSPASDSSIGKEGRLQKETAANATSIAIGSSPSSVIYNLLNLFSPSSLVSVLTNTLNVGEDGTLGVNERPELNINGEMYSVLLWKGWQSTVSKYLVPVQQAIANAGALVRNIPFLNKVSSVFTQLGLNAGQTIQPESNQLYFILNENDAIKYMSKYTATDRDPILISDIETFQAQEPATALADMTYKDLALENRYSTDERLEWLTSHLTDQINQNKQDSSIYHLRGISGGIYPDNLPDNATQNEINYQSFALSVSGSYFDGMNGPRFAIISGSTLPSDLPQDYIDFHIYDVVNDLTIPFRSSIRRIAESVNPSYTEEKYIGRIERNVIFSGATRKLVVGMWAVVFSPDELDVIWQRLNRLTGLCYPAKYTSDGYMVPNFLRLTIGNYYNQQPGYLSSVTYDIGDTASWVLEAGSQVPRYIPVDFTFEVIEKEAMTASSPYYGFGAPQT